MRSSVRASAIVSLSAALLWAAVPGFARSRVSASMAYVAPDSAALPNPGMTPGAVDPRVMQSNLGRTICRPGGYTKSVRPPVDYTENLKRQQIEAYGYPDHRLRDYEEDHLISLELGGSPTSPQNLWPEPHYTSGGWGSFTKDQLENRLHTMVCHGMIPLAQAQYKIAHDWISAYRQYVSSTPRDE